MPKGHLWVMGDNRGFSYDSRGHMGDPGGGVRRRATSSSGKVFALIWPWKRAEIIHRPATFEGIPRRAVSTVMSTLPRGSTVRRDAGLYGYERALRRAGLAPIAGVDEAGRGACAGPLVAAAAILPEGKAGQVPGLADSKLLTAKARERCYDQILRRALAWSVVVVAPDECDRLGMHVANVEALRRALARLDAAPVVRPHRRLPGRRARRARPRDVEGRPGRRLHRGRVGASPR